MKIAIVGYTGAVGRRLVAEALRRGHQVTGLARHPHEPDAPGLTVEAADAADPAALALRLTGHDAVVSATPFRSTDPGKLLEAVRRSGVRRYLVVGGAGSLWASPGVLHLDSDDFPEFAREEATRGKAVLDLLRTVEDLDWTMLSPSALLTAGARTGEFRLGGDDLLRAQDGRSWISYEDYAVALIDEIERPAHLRRRFTVGY